MDWVEQADQFWAIELGVAPHVFRTGGFQVFERADADPQPRAVVVGTSSAAIVSFPEGRAHAFEQAGLNLEGRGARREATWPGARRTSFSRSEVPRTWPTGHRRLHRRHRGGRLLYST